MGENLRIRIIKGAGGRAQTRPSTSFAVRSLFIWFITEEGTGRLGGYVPLNLRQLRISLHCLKKSYRNVKTKPFSTMTPRENTKYLFTYLKSPMGFKVQYRPPKLK